ncbi:MAG: glycine cleavage T C-terminal barrel domain-containing protein [bacterium]|nr:glycine cleavage T C-terminal barrel domain-containing protein [bacterium]
MIIPKDLKYMAGQEGARVKCGDAAVGTPFQVEIRGKLVPAKVAETPFWKNSSIKK